MEATTAWNIKVKYILEKRRIKLEKMNMKNFNFLS